MSLASKNKRNRMLRVLVAALIAADLVSKYLIFAKSMHTSFIMPLLNTGASWSIPLGVPVIIIATLLACIALIYLLYKKFIYDAAFVLLFAGALGNLYDRVVFGWVRDRIQISLFPVFNLADVMITLGVILIAWQYKQQSRKAKYL